MRRALAYVTALAVAWRVQATETIALALRDKGVLRTDANETAAFVRELEYVETEVQKKIYPPEQFPMLSIVPIDPSIPPWAKHVTWRVKDWVGQYKWIAANANDIPVIGEESGLEKTTPVQTYAAKVTWDVDDIRFAVAMQINLPVDKMANLKEGANFFADKGLAIGDPSTGMPGLLNNTNITTDGAGQLPNGGDWANPAVTGEEILGDLDYMVTVIPDVTRNAYLPDTLVLPQSLYSVLNRKRVDTGVASSETVLQRFKADHPEITIIWTWRLDTADAAGTGPRAIVFKRSLDVVKGVLPVVYETLPPQYIDRMVVVHASGRCGGVILRGPGGIRYFDDI